MTLAQFDIGPMHFEVTTWKVWTLGILMLSVALHESAHAYVASWCGDPTPKAQGRKTLNPLKHLDPVMSVLLPMLIVFGTHGYLFGAGRPVRVSPLHMRVPDRDNALVALAGPATNALLVVLFTLVHVIGLRQGFSSSADPASGGNAALMGYVMREGITINLLLMIFNLIPIPPLDGSRLVAYLLPSFLKGLWYRLDVIGFVVLIVLLFTGVLGQIFHALYVPTRDFWVRLYS